MSLARGKPGWPGWQLGLVLGTGALLGFLLAATLNEHTTSAPDAGASVRGLSLATTAATASPLPAQAARELAEVLQRVSAGYVDPVDEHVLMQQAARGMVASLDSHSALLDAADYAQLRAATDGSYAGIGVEVDGNAGALRIVRCLPASPALRAGLKGGDQIVRIDGREVGAANIDAAAAQLRGPPGSTVRLAVRRGTGTSAGASTLDFQLTRSQVELASTAAETLAPGFGYLRIREFTSATPAEVDAAIAQLRAQAGGRLRGLVIDLRDNPGGVLEAAGTVADDFLERGTIVSADGRLREARFRMVATPGDLIDGAPIAVLVNGNSASAAEILAAALRQNGRALLLGARTYGKGTVQTLMPLSDGRALKLTTARYYTPAGDSINGIGIEPDRVLGSAQQAPASIDATGRAPTLARRDAPVAIALAELRGAAVRPTHTY
ncbi:MAG: S41 family peptidase [Proteobacteria bacterium]|nr:S41 family peptidase [Pseudomonadota bacterium]